MRYQFRGLRWSRRRKELYLQLALLRAQAARDIQYVHYLQAGLAKHGKYLQIDFEGKDALERLTGQRCPFRTPSPNSWLGSVLVEGHRVVE